MVRILSMSDLHLEFAEFPFEVASWPDLIVLAGDIGHGIAGIEFARQQIPTSVHVIVLAANHEFYGSSIERVTHALRAEAEGLINVHFLDCDEITISLADRNVRVLGATLWTDFALRGEAMCARDMEVAHQRMDDFRLIESRGRPLTPHDTTDLHEAARN